MSAVVLTLPVALFLAAVHVLSARLTHLDPVPRSAWLSFGGGVSVAYVFMHVIPELAAHEDKLRDQGSALAAETQVFAMALAGLVAFYGLERMARVSSRGEARGGGAAVFWVHIGSFALYNGLIGYLLLHREELTKISQKIRESGFTLVPLQLYFLNGRAKVELAVARGKRDYDKRQTLREKQDNREALRAMREKNLGA